jgi:hypothetical protein
MNIFIEYSSNAIYTTGSASFFYLKFNMKDQLHCLKSFLQRILKVCKNVVDFSTFL